MHAPSRSLAPTHHGHEHGAAQNTASTASAAKLQARSMCQPPRKQTELLRRNKFPGCVPHSRPLRLASLSWHTTNTCHNNHHNFVADSSRKAARSRPPSTRRSSGVRCVCGGINVTAPDLHLFVALGQARSTARAIGPPRSVPAKRSRGRNAPTMWSRPAAAVRHGSSCAGAKLAPC